MIYPVKQTPYTFQEFHDAMKSAYYTNFGYDCPDVMIKLCFSQSIVETGYYNYSLKQGGKSCFNYNVGNIKYTQGAVNGCSTGYHMLSNVWEIIDGKKVIFNPPHIQTHFRAYDSLLEGVTDYQILLSNRTLVWKVLHDSQEPLDYVNALYAAHYFTADPRSYLYILNSVYKNL